MAHSRFQPAQALSEQGQAFDTVLLGLPSEEGSDEFRAKHILEKVCGAIIGHDPELVVSILSSAYFYFSNLREIKIKTTVGAHYLE